MANERSWYFCQGDFVSHQGHLSDMKYGRLLDNVVVACVDVALVWGTRLLVVQRAREPYRYGWWVLGGRMNPGERREQTAQRIVRCELTLPIDDLSRFEDLGESIDYVWARRAQPPVSHGCHMQGTCFMVRLETDEAKAIKVASDFFTQEWVNVREIALGQPAYIKWHEAMVLIADRVSQRLPRPCMFRN